VAVGRISGPLLKANLLRNGVDLAFETDLLYLDVNNTRVGIKTASPQYALDINGTTRSTDIVTTGTAFIGDVRISGNTVHTVDPVLNLTTVGTDKVVSLKTLEIDDLRFDTNVISTTISNANIDIIPNGTGEVDIQANTNITGDLDVTGNVTADGDITVGGNVQLGDEATDTINIVAGITSDIKPATTATYNLGLPGKRWNNLHTASAWIDDIHIDAGVIENTISSADLELRTNGTGSIIVDEFIIKDNTIQTATSDITMTPGSGIVDINTTGSVRIPSGTTAQRPSVPAVGMIRFNTTTSRFEGYDGNWIVLTGVFDLDADTYITAELTPGANDNIIRFYSAGSEIASITATEFNVSKLNIDDIQIDGNTISTTTLNTDLNLLPNGTGGVNIDNINISGSEINNTVSGAATRFTSTGTGYVEIVGVDGVVLPVGTSAERHPSPVLGMTRWNTTDGRLEIFNAVTWESVAGTSGSVSTTDAENIALQVVLSLG
jgi:hypothetical protein